MTSPELAAAFVVAVVPLAVAARWLVLSRRGLLVWGAQGPLVVASALIMLSAVAITAGGFAVQQLIPPLLIMVIGGALAVRRWGSAEPVNLRRLGLAALFGGALMLLRGLAIVMSGGI
jgi:hypothetical protein